MSGVERAWIQSHIPHQGKMCLLDRVLAWDADNIHCTSGTHRDADNPLRDQGRLAAICGAEYGAQATAIHGALLHETSVKGINNEPNASCPPQKGYLVSIRDLGVEVEALDRYSCDLDVHAKRLSASAQGAQYEIKLLAGTQLLLAGRVMIKFIS
jgi:predicted hotdog family 3-hydroxylacyl-ACP dehydratase